jgi:hypothetical protein
VLRLSFGGGVVQSRAELDRRIRALLHDNAERLGLPCRDPEDPVGCFAELIGRAHAEHGERVVVLVDEYDKPILDNLTRPDIAREARDGLRICRALSILTSAKMTCRLPLAGGRHAWLPGRGPMPPR